MIKKTLIMVLIFIILLLNSACSFNKNGNVNTSSSPYFAIYLVKDANASEALKKNINKLALEDDPVITDENISNYIWKEHKLILIKDEKLHSIIKEKIGMKVPTSGKPFVVVCNGERIYTGLFWTLLSSLSAPKCPVIMSEFYDGDFLQICFAYDEDDIRNDRRIYKTFEEMGKLK